MIKLNASSYLNWLPLSDRKGMPDVSVYFKEHADSQGQYVYWNNQIILTNVEPDTIAHEYRHHIQHKMFGWDFKKTYKYAWHKLENKYSAEDAYTIYFSYNLEEFDAFRYELKFIPEKYSVLHDWNNIFKKLKAGYWKYAD